MYVLEEIHYYKKIQNGELLFVNVISTIKDSAKKSQWRKYVCAIGR